MAEAKHWNELMFSETFGEDADFLVSEMPDLIMEERGGLRIIRGKKHG
jgi:hypothetical protein